jgi:peptidoglycan hydrolase CwlO-like protein
MKKEIFIAVAIAVVVLLAIGLTVFAFGSQNKDCSLLANQDSKDDCYHSLAHQMNNKAICNSIQNAEKKEHCFGHIPGD